MMEKTSRPLKIALHGMDGRTIKTMSVFLQRTCEGAAYIVENIVDADVDIFDEESSFSQVEMEQHIRENILKPTIVFSSYNCSRENVFYVKKPINASDMLGVLGQVKELISRTAVLIPSNESTFGTQINADEIGNQKELKLKSEGNAFLFKHSYDKKNAKLGIAMNFDGGEFADSISRTSGLDVNDPKQCENAFYDPYDYYQGAIQAAVAECVAKNRIFLFESDWQPIALFPRTHELWVNAGDEELRYMAGLKLNHKRMASTFSLAQLDPAEVDLGVADSKFQNIESFIWKLACWTSLGRYPKEIDYNQPVFLKNWPNFTRLLITPYALKIAALLVQGPMTMANIAQTLNIKPQYVFIFISATYAAGLAGQARRSSDTMVVTGTKKKSFNDESALSNLANRLYTVKA